VEAHINRALTLNNVGRVDEGREAFEQAARYEQQASDAFPAALSARLANAHAATGDLYAAAGAQREAEEQYRRALELRPHFQDIRNKLGQCLLEQGQNEPAAAEFRKALAGNERFLAARLNLGLAYERMGRRSAALEEWRRCERQDPEHPQVRAYLATTGAPAEEADAH
jgi:tetratricopeptide (TPR) repeat protein